MRAAPSWLVAPAVAVPGRHRLAATALADIAGGLARVAAMWGTRLEGDAMQRRGARLLATEAYDAWLLVWPPGTNVTPHDHGDSAGVFTVASGELLETRWRGALSRTRLVGRGETVAIEPGVVHDVAAGAVAAVSVHVYSPPLTSMGYFDGRGVRRVDEVDTVVTSRLLHPAGAGRPIEAGSTLH